MMRSLEQVLITFLASLSGITVASIGGLPGIPHGRKEKKGEEPSWIDWGGSDLKIPEISQSQQAFEAGTLAQAYRPLRKVRRKVKQGSIKVRSPAFTAQLNNNLAVSAYSRSQRVEDPNKRQRLQNVAQSHITRAARIRTTSIEVTETVTRNQKLIKRRKR